MMEFARDIGVGRAGLETGFDDLRACFGEWACCIEDQMRGPEGGCQRSRVVERQGAELQAHPVRHGLQLWAAASRQDRTVATAERFLNDEAAGVAIGAVDQPLM